MIAFLCALRALTCTLTADVTRLNVKTRMDPRPEWERSGAHVGLSIAMHQGGALQTVLSARCNISKKAVGCWRLVEKLVSSRGEDDDDKILRRQALAK